MREGTGVNGGAPGADGGWESRGCRGGREVNLDQKSPD